MYMGIFEGIPSIFVDQSTLVTFRRILGRNQILHGWERDKVGRIGTRVPVD